VSRNILYYSKNSDIIYLTEVTGMRQTFRYNKFGLKDSVDQYRNVGGKHYICWTSDVSIFNSEKEKAKQEGLSCRIIKGELYKEVLQNG
jgi:hypothetical protein